MDATENFKAYPNQETNKDIRKRKELLLMHESGAVMSYDGSYIFLQEHSSDQCLMEMGLEGIPSF